MNIHRKYLTLGSLAALAGLVAFLPSCVNVFGFADNPDGDQQLISAARACFDDGDLECARQYYNRLSRDKVDVQQSELAYAILDEAGAGMGDFVKAFGEGNGGDGMTKLANHLSTKGAGVTLRLTLFSAYQKAVTNGTNIIADRNLRGLVKFVAGVALAAELLAEASGTNGILQKSDLVTSPTACTGGCAGVDADCAKPGASALADAGAVTDLSTATTGTGSMGATTPDLSMLNAVLSAVYSALNSDLTVSSGKFNTGTLAFVAQFGSLAIAAPAHCYRQTLVSSGVGAN